MGMKLLRVTPARAALAGLVLAALPMVSFGYVSIGVSINIAPPALPVYVQPPCPAVGYIWTPGYWAWDDGDYYWVPGTWILPPAVGLLWTPGYWGWSDGYYLWHAGYWGPHVGFYGGVNYGYGYTGVGFEGGYWRGGAFYYNRSVANLGGLHVTNVYNRTVVNNITVNRVSYNGGEGGLRARPSPRELSADREHHVEYTSVQREHEHMAFGNHDLRASVNGGKPRIAATERPTVFSGRGVIEARAAGAPYHGGGHGAGDRGGPAHGPDMRAAAHGGPGRGPDVRATDHGPAAVRNDRPPGASMRGGPVGGFNGGTGPNAGHTETRVDPRMNQMNQMRMEHNSSRPQNMSRVPEAPRMQEAPRQQMAPRMQEAPRQQMAPRMQEAPRQQMAPRMQEAPRQPMAQFPQNAPRPDFHRGGEPRGQGQPQVQGRGPQDRERR